LNQSFSDDDVESNSNKSQEDSIAIKAPQDK
jgi:hypothetical protein